jgi:cyclic-di-AMP phosphodiesterase PgpH
MFGLAQKRTRVPKAVALRRPLSWRSRLWQGLRDPGVQVRLWIVLLASVLLVLALQSWKAPFPFRQGDYVQHGIAAKIPFERIDQQETERAYHRAEETVAYIFRHDPGALESLPEELRTTLGEVAQAESIEQLSEETGKAFGLIPFEPESAWEQIARQRYPAQDPETRFRSLRAAVIGSDMTRVQDRIETMVQEFSEFLQPLREGGLIDPDTVRQESITADRRIRVLDEGEGEKIGREVLLPQVRLQDLLTEAGRLGRSWTEYPSLPPEIHRALSHWLIVRAQPTLRYDKAATTLARSQAREGIEDRMERFIEGDLLVRPGKVLDANDLALLWEEYQTAESRIGWPARVTRMGIVFVMILVLVGINGFYMVLNEPRLIRDVGRLTTYLTAIVLTALIGRMVSFDPLRAEVVPLLAVVLLISIAYNQFLATLTAFSLALVLTLSTTGRLDQFIVLISTAAAAIIPLGRVSSRSTLIKASFVSAIVYFIINCGVMVVETQSPGEVFRNTQVLVMSIKGAALCLVAGYLVAGSLPFVESTFGVVTDMTLLELSDQSHPLLQDLVRLAPGTYNHSISVASIAETAAERIGAHGLLVRVGAYYHDVGKMLKPQYFIENVQEGTTSRHEQLNPTMSTLIIIGHVKDGADLAEQYGLPQQLIDFIEQHHGTTLVEYFYREATKLAEGQPDHQADVEESAFRYPGPKPQTKEAGILMIADACESSCRTLTEPTSKRIETLVHNIVMQRLLDGQFDECPLRMTDLRTVEESVCKSLIGIYHGRIRYPEAQDARTA